MSAKKKRNTLSDLARRHGIARSTLANRLNRREPLERALTRPPMDPRESGRRGAERSPWRWQ